MWYMLDDETFISKVHHCLQQAEVASSHWRKRAREDFDFVAGEQYSDEDRAILEEQMRPIITFNRIGPVIDAVCGAEVSHRQNIQYIPRKEGETDIHQLLTGAAQWVRDQSDAWEEESDAFQDVAICGMGWIETRLDYDHDPEGQICIERVDPFEIYWDPQARKKNLIDAQWLLRVKEVSLDEIKILCPEQYKNIEADIITDHASSNTSPTVKIMEFQWKEKTKYYKIFNNLKKEFEVLNKDKYQKLIAKCPQKITAEICYQDCYYQALICENTLIEKQVSPAEKSGFTYLALTGKRHRNQNSWFGLVHAMKDPQRWANKWLSQALHIVNANAKGGLMAERNAFVNPRKAEEDWADPTSIILLNEGGLNKVKPKPSLQYPSGLDRLMDLAIHSIRDVSGVNLEMLGLVDRQQPGILEKQRKQASLTILSGLFESLKRYRKDQARLLLHYIRHYISDGRLIKIQGHEGAHFVPLLKDNDTYLYDVIVDEMPQSTNPKEDIFRVFQQLLPFLMQSNIPLPLDLIDHLPLPESLIRKWKEQLSQTPKAENN